MDIDIPGVITRLEYDFYTILDERTAEGSLRDYLFVVTMNDLSQEMGADDARHIEENMGDLFTFEVELDGPDIVTTIHDNHAAQEACAVLAEIATEYKDWRCRGRDIFQAIERVLARRKL